MPFVLTSVMQKGGTGKTTLTLNLAEVFREQGKRVAVVDLDAQGTVRTWRDCAELAGHPDTVPVVGSTGPQLRSTIIAMSPGIDVFVIDTPPRLGPEARAAVMLATLVLVPVTPGGADVWELCKVRDLLDEVRGARLDAGPQVRAVLNFMQPQAALCQAMRAHVEAEGFAVTQAQLGYRIAHREATSAGRSILGHARRSPAAREMLALADEVTSLFTAPVVAPEMGVAA